MWERHGPVLTGFLILSCLFYAPVLAGIRSFPDGDFVHHFFPFIVFQQSEYLAGYFPIWNPYTFSGHPFLADIQSAVLYPLSNGLLLPTLFVTDAAARFYLLEVEAILHIVLAGAGMYLFVRRISGRRMSGVMAGICFAYSGYLTGYPTTQLAVIRTGAWLPLILYAVDRAFSTPTAIRWWLTTGLLAAIAFFGGHAQTMLYIVYVTGAWVGLEVALRVFGRKGKTYSSSQVNRYVVGISVAAVSAFGLAAVQLIPALEFTALSVRARVDYAFVSGGFPLHDTWQLLLPGVFTWYSPLYIGVPGLMLAGLALVTLKRPTPTTAPLAYSQSRRHFSWSIIFFALLAAIALLVSYGAQGFLYALFYQFLPGWDRFRGQERAAYVVAFSLSMLAGLGLARLPEMPTIRRKRFALSAGAFGVAAVYGFGLWWQLLGRTAIAQWRYLAVAGMTIALAMAVALIIWLPGWSRRRTGLLFILAMLNLFVVNFSTSSAPGTPGDRVQHAPEIVALQEALEHDVQEKGISGRVYNEYRVYDDYGMRTRIEDVWGSSPLKLATYAPLLGDFPLDRMWRLTGVQYVLTWRRELFVPSTLLGEYPQHEDTTYLHRLSDPNPQVWIVTETAPLRDDEAYAMLADHNVDLDQVAVLDELQPAVTWPEGSRTASVVHLSSSRIHVEAQSEHGGLLVVAENWMPGWRVENVACREDVIDDTCRPAGYEENRPPLLAPVPTNVTFVGLHIPPGSIAFDLVYRPRSLLIGGTISLVTLLLFMFGAVTGGQWLK